MTVRALTLEQPTSCYNNIASIQIKFRLMFAPNVSV